MRKRFSLIPLILALLVLGGLPTAASADYRKVYSDCSDGTIDGSYTAKELQQALQNLEGNLSDYSDCADAIVTAQNGGPTKKKKASGGGASGGGTTGGGSGTTGGGTLDPTSLAAARTADPTEIVNAGTAAAEAANQATHDGAVDLDDIQIPASSLQLGASGAGLPLPLLLVLIACAVAACIAGGATGLQALRRRRGH